MGEHYFTSEPGAAHELRQITLEANGQLYRFFTDTGVFSKGRIDKGTDLLIKSILNHARIKAGDRVLDLGCGYGPLGIVIAAAFPGAVVVMTDINKRAAELAARNAALNGVSNVIAREGDGLAAFAGEPDFDCILMNPPIRAGKEKVFGLIRDAHVHLRPGGELWFVARTKQGVKSLEKFCAGVFSEVEEVAKKGGYRVVRAIS